MKKLYQEDMQKKSKQPNKGLIKNMIKSARISTERPIAAGLNTEKARQSENSLKVELQNSIEFTEKVKQEVSS